MRSVGFGLLYALSRLASLSVAKELPDWDDFYRVSLGNIATLGDYVYVEGGEFSYKEQDSKKAATQTLKATLSLAVNESWTADAIEYNEIDRGNKPKTKDNTLWVDETNKRIYQWDGTAPWGAGGAVDRQLWGFDPDGKGGGSWSVVETSNPSALLESTRMSMAAATVCGGKGFILGGWASPRTDTRVDVELSIPVPGMVSFDFATKEWKNISDPLMPGTKHDNGVLFRSQAVCVKGFGGKEFVMPIGGVSSDLSTVNETGDNWIHISMETLRLFDVEEEKWIEQKATGDPRPPETRWDHCAVGVPSGNGTYEIFLYGGRTKQSKALSEVWILTLPGFHWIKADVDTTPRYYHECTLAGKSGRDILVFGGYDQAAWFKKDPWKRGIGVWDMSKMDWKSEYDGNGADKYEPAAAVQKWYAGGGMGDMEWNSDDVKRIFTTKEDGEHGNTSGDDDEKTDGKSTGTSSSNDDNNSDRDTQEKQNDRSSPPAAAIAGGAAGGVAAIAGIGLLFWFIRRRKRAGRSLSSGSSDTNSDVSGGSAELARMQSPSVYKQSVEIDGYRIRQPRAELDCSYRAELEGSPYSPPFGSHAKQ